MKFICAIFCLMLCMAASPAAAKEPAGLNQENCRQAICAALEQLRRIPPEMNQRDDEQRRKLLAEMERLVEDNRRAGVSECGIWGELMGKAFNQ